MKHTVASALAAAGVPLLNHWGVTEIGAIAPIMTPPPDYDWRFLRVRDDIHLRFQPLPEHPGHVRLTGRPPLIADDFVVQDLLVVVQLVGEAWSVLSEREATGSFANF